MLHEAAACAAAGVMVRPILTWRDRQRCEYTEDLVALSLGGMVPSDVPGNII